MSWCRGLLLLLLIATAASAAPGAPWWDDAWSARHRLRVPYRMAAHVDAVGVDMTTFGWLAEDGSDLRVVSRDGDLCPHRIFQVGPGDRVRFLFRPVGGHDVFYAYFGNPRADPPGETLSHKAGLVLEVGDLPAGRYNRAREVLDLWSRTKVRATTLRPRISSPETRAVVTPLTMRCLAPRPTGRSTSKRNSPALIAALAIGSS